MVENIKEQLFKEYVKVLRSKIGTDYYYSLQGDPEIDPEDIARKMFKAIENSALMGSRNDYINHNPALKQACKKVGITSNSELREIMLQQKSRKTRRKVTKR